MSSRERIHSLEGRSSQGMMRHGPILVPHGVTRSMDHPSPPIELLEEKDRSQASEIDRLVAENRRLGSTHGTLRQELLNNQHEAHRLKAHISSIQTESDIQIRLLIDKSAKFEAEVRGGDGVKTELQKVHKEAQGLVAARQEIMGRIQLANQELRKACMEAERLPDLHGELDRLVQEHHRLRVTFEIEKDRNIEQVRQMQAMEKNLMSMAREVEALRAKAMKADNKVHGGFGNHQHHPSHRQQVPVSGPSHDGPGLHLAPAGPANRGSSDGSAVWSGGASYDPSLAPQ